MVKASQNPQAMVKYLVQSNPQVKQAMDIINSSGGDAEKAFYDLAKEKGVDPNVILQQFQ